MYKPAMPEQRETRHHEGLRNPHRPGQDHRGFAGVLHRYRALPGAPGDQRAEQADQQRAEGVHAPERRLRQLMGEEIDLDVAVQQVAVGKEGGRGGRGEHLQHFDVAGHDEADGLAPDDGNDRHDHQADENDAAADCHHPRQKQKKISARSEGVLQRERGEWLRFLHSLSLPIMSLSHTRPWPAGTTAYLRPHVNVSARPAARSALRSRVPAAGRRRGGPRSAARLPRPWPRAAPTAVPAPGAGRRAR